MKDTAQARHVRTEAMYRFEKGDLPQAERQLDALIADLTPPRSPQLRFELCNALTDRATIYRYVNRWDEALEDLNDCEALTVQMGALSAGLFSRNVDYLRAKICSTPHTPFYRPEAALAAIERVRKIGGIDFACDELESQLSFQAKDWERTASLALRAVQALESDGWKRGAASCRRLAGDALREQGALGPAEEQLIAAREYLKDFGSPGDLADANLSLARLRSMQKSHDEAWRLAHQALSFLDQLIRRFTSLSEQQRFLIDKQRRYQEAFDIALAEGGDAACMRAWTVAERSKSFYLCQLIASSEIRLVEGVRPEDIDHWRALEEELDEAERTLGRLRAAGRVDTQSEQLERTIRELAEKKQRQLEHIMKQNPRWGSLTAPAELRLEQVINDLPSGWIPVSFYWHQDYSTASDTDENAVLHVFWMDENRRPHCCASNLSSQEISSFLSCQELLSSEVDPLAEVFPDHLAEKIFPIRLCSSIPRGYRLLVSLHGRLHMLPLHAMRMDDGEYLIERWAVQYIPTLALLPLRRNVVPRYSVLLIGSGNNGFGDKPLPQVETELEFVTEIWNKTHANRVTCRQLGPNGTLEEAGIPIGTWEDYDQIHIACHGFFPQGRAFDAALRLGKEAVRASEFFAIKLNASLVTLSACQVGRQAVKHAGIDVVGSEWIGLLLALMYAGAHRVVASNWDANSEEAVKIMQVMHESISNDGATPVDALCDAIKAAVEPSLPPLWANWFVVGLPE